MIPFQRNDFGPSKDPFPLPQIDRLIAFVGGAC